MREAAKSFLLMVRKYFSTNIKHGAIYDFEDLLADQEVPPLTHDLNKYERAEGEPRSTPTSS